LFVWICSIVEVEEKKFGDVLNNRSLSKWREKRRVRSKLNKEQNVQECDATGDK